LKACEIAFTYGVYIKEKQKKEIKEIRETAKKLDIRLSIHAPYWINLNSKEKKKIKESKQRIIESCKIGEMLGAYRVVFHPGYYGGMDEEKTYQNIKKAVLDIQKKIKKWKIKIAPETTGKVNVFGKEKEILRLVKDTKCSFCVDFAHLLARSQGKETYKQMYDKFKKFKQLHCHFSGIVWGSKGERRHKRTPTAEIKKLLSALPKNKDIVLISESPNPVKDSVRSLSVYKKL
jgi:deoxyribonuclease-4